MNAQGKTAAARKTAAAVAPKTLPVKANEAATPARPVKKRKFSKIESVEGDTEFEDGSDGKDRLDAEAADDH